jgi:hypothetical protein
MNTAVLLENQRLMNADPTSTDVADFKRISIPLVRRIYPQLIANKIVSVQPLTGPTGLVYYLRHKYSSQQPINDNTWTIKPKKKKIWRDITEPWEPSDEENVV